MHNAEFATTDVSFFLFILINFKAIAIAEGLIQNGSIRKLDISDNKIDDDGFFCFEKVPLMNYTLEKLNVSKNTISVS